MRNILLLSLLWAMSSLVVGCGSQTADAPASASEEAASDPQANTGLIRLSAEQIKLSGLGYADLSRQNWGNEIKVNAELVVHPEDMTVLSSFSDGMITELRTRLNASVNKGDVLAVIRKPDLLDLQQTYLENKDRMAFLQAEFERYQALKDADATATKNYQRAEADLRAARTSSQVLAAKLKQYQIDPERLTADNLSTQIKVVAPNAGLVTALYVGLGSAIQPGTPICQLTDMNKLHADLWLFEKDLSRAQLGQQVRIRFPADESAVFTATIFSIDRVLDPEKRALRAHARLEGAPRHPSLVHGAFAEASIITTQAPNAIVLPEEAIVREGQEDFIFLLVKENKAEAFFQKVKVDKSPAQDGQSAVVPVSELPAQARIVAKGAYYVSAQAAEFE